MIHIETEYITLQQFLKLAGIASTGGHAKILVQTEEIYVNGERENRRGKKLRPGDEVVVEGKKYVIG